MTKKIKKSDLIYDGIPKGEMSESARRLMQLINGAEPLNESERKMVAEIKEIKDSGQIPWIPSD